MSMEGGCEATHCLLLNNLFDRVSDPGSQLGVELAFNLLPHPTGVWSLFPSVEQFVKFLCLFCDRLVTSVTRRTGPLSLFSFDFTLFFFCFRRRLTCLLACCFSLGRPTVGLRVFFNLTPLFRRVQNLAILMIGFILFSLTKWLRGKQEQRIVFISHFAVCCRN